MCIKVIEKWGSREGVRGASVIEMRKKKDVREKVYGRKAACRFKGRKETKKEAESQANEEEGERSADASSLFLINLRAEGHRGVFTGRGSRGNKVKKGKVKMEL